MINERQRLWESEAAFVLSKVERSGTAEEDETRLHELASAIVDDWWVLQDEMLLRFGDGWEYEWADNGEARHAPLAYPRAWLEQVRFFDKKP